MYIRFGNLTVKEFAEIADAKFTDEEVDTLESYRTDTAALEGNNTFHIFRDPLGFSIGIDAHETVVPILVAANNRSTFNREVFVATEQQR